MPKNIVIFSDGTGQRGGLTFDERRSNIYKLFRASRCGPDSSVNPNLQLTYYDPGLGTVPEGTGFFGSLYRKLHNIVSQATGLGITENIIDCYQEIIRVWEPGDRIYLFGFSRGAYTARCLGAVLCLCGVPTKGKDSTALRRDEKTLRAIARQAVSDVYQHVGSPKDTEYVEQRKALAKQFRERYGAGNETDSNAYPHFIGVFDTVASLANVPFIGFLLGVSALVVWGLSFLLSFLALTTFIWASFIGIAAVTLLGAWYLENHLKYATDLPGYTFWQTLHLTASRMQFYDKSLNMNVGWARHALAIDEHRASFDRVQWGNKGSDFPQRGEGNPLWLKQFWFAGNHSDIGGSYPENESRLSDVALLWMVEEAQKVPNPLIIDTSVLRLYPSAAGMQHDESQGRLFKYAKKINRQLVPNATLHPSVFERFDLPAVLQLDEVKPYRPTALSIHEKLAGFYSSDKTIA
jgi:uncharacterized protein (DUF2235 family)